MTTIRENTRKLFSKPCFFISFWYFTACTSRRRQVPPNFLFFSLFVSGLLLGRTSLSSVAVAAELSSATLGDTAFSGSLLRRGWWSHQGLPCCCCPGFHFLVHRCLEAGLVQGMSGSGVVPRLSRGFCSRFLSGRPTRALVGLLLGDGRHSIAMPAGHVPLLALTVLGSSSFTMCYRPGGLATFPASVFLLAKVEKRVGHKWTKQMGTNNK